MRAPINKFSGRERAQGQSPLLKPLTLIALILIGVFSFAALFVLIGYGDDLRQKENGQATPISQSAVGYAGLVQLLEGVEFDVSLDPKPFKSDWKTKNRLRIYTPSNIFMGAKFEGLGDETPKLIVLPKWSVTPLENKPGWVRKHWSSSFMRAEKLSIIIGGAGDDIYLDFIKQEDFPIPAKLFFEDTNRSAELDGLQFMTLAAPVRIGPEEVVEIIIDSDDEETKSEADSHEIELKPVSPEDFDAAFDEDVIASPKFETILSTENAEAVLIKLLDSRTYVLSDPDLLNTMGLAKQSRAALAVNIIQSIIRREELDPQSVTFDLSIHGVGSKPNLIKLMTQPPFLAATLCLLGAAMLIGWQGFARFGDPQKLAPDYSLGPASLAKTSAAFLGSAGRLGSMGHAYAQMTRRQVMRRLGLTGMHTDIVEKRLAARETLRKISPKYEDLKHIPASEGAMGFTARAKALANWKEEMLREP